jgi:hypothetical protein
VSIWYFTLSELMSLPSFQRSSMSICSRVCANSDVNAATSTRNTGAIRRFTSTSRNNALHAKRWNAQNPRLFPLSEFLAATTRRHRLQERDCRLECAGRGGHDDANRQPSQVGNKSINVPDTDHVARFHSNLPVHRRVADSFRVHDRKQRIHHDLLCSP